LNGFQTPFEQIMTLPPAAIDFIDVTGRAQGAANVVGGWPIIAIYLKDNAESLTIGRHNIRYPGFYKAREFYSPDYSVANDRHKYKDLRTLLYWKPVVELSRNGEADLKFYTPDRGSQFKVVVEGVTEDGSPIHATTMFGVKQ
jgi:hypothetical protein